LLEIGDDTLQSQNLFGLVSEVVTASGWRSLSRLQLTSLSQFLKLKTILSGSFDVFHRFGHHPLEFLDHFFLLLDGLLVGPDALDFLTVLRNLAGQTLDVVVHGRYRGV